MYTYGIGEVSETDPSRTDLVVLVTITSVQSILIRSDNHGVRLKRVFRYLTSYGQMRNCSNKGRNPKTRGLKTRKMRKRSLTAKRLQRRGMRTRDLRTRSLKARVLPRRHLDRNSGRIFLHRHPKMPPSKRPDVAHLEIRFQCLRSGTSDAGMNGTSSNCLQSRCHRVINEDHVVFR